MKALRAPDSEASRRIPGAGAPAQRRSAKGQRDRYVMLSPQLLELLRDWWWAARPQVWLFPGQNPVNRMRALTTALLRRCVSPSALLSASARSGTRIR
jgi:integrase